MEKQSIAQDLELSSVMEIYGWKPDHIQQLRYVWKVTCGDKVYALKRSSASREKLLLLYKILQHARKEGFTHLLPWVKTSAGENVVTFGETNWYAISWVAPSKESLQYPLTSFEIAKALGFFHRICENAVAPFMELHKRLSANQLNMWRQKSTQLMKYRDWNRSKEFPSPFDKEFLLHIDQLGKSIQFCVKGTEKFIELEKGIFPRHTLCHMRIHPTNIVKDDKNFYFIDFDNSEVDTPVRDLATLMRRHSLHQGEPDELLEIIMAYESENALSAKEKKLLALFLSYPERILRLSEQYYEKPRIAQSETDLMHKMEEEGQHFNALQTVVTQLWPVRKQKVKSESPPARTRKGRGLASRKKDSTLL